MTSGAVGLRQARLHVVTGKGGTGKTTVAAALALMLARDGGRVLLMEVEGRQGLARLFDLAPLPYREVPLARTPGDGEVRGLAVDPEAALLDYLETFYNLRRAGSVLRRLGAIDFATTIAPGLRDVLLTGKASEAVRRRDDGRVAYDAVVVDGPPTGRIGRFLNVTSEVSDLARVGPIRAHADLVADVIHSPQTMVHVVSTLEEMPTQEAIDAVAELRSLEIPVGAFIVSMTRPEHLTASDTDALLHDRVDVDAVTSSLTSVRGLSKVAVSSLVPGLLDEGRDHARRVLLESRERARLESVGLPMLELPFVATGVDRAVLASMADLMAEQVDA